MTQRLIASRRMHAHARQREATRAITHILESSLPGARRRPRQVRAVETTTAIVEAAGRLLVERGYARVSTNAIAARAGVSIGSLYQYFEDKDAIFRGLVREHHQQVQGIIDRSMLRMIDPNVDLVTEILEIMRELGKMHARNPALMRAIVTDLAALESDAADEAQLLPRIAALLRSRREYRGLDIEVAARLLMLTTEHLSRWLAHYAPHDVDSERFLRGAERMLRGLLAPKCAKPLVRHTQGSAG